MYIMRRHTFNKTARIGLIVAGILAAPVSADAAGVKVGVLTCHEASGWGFIVESTRDLRCVFSPSSGPSSRYTGHISKFGVDIGYMGASVIVWSVVASEMHAAPDALAGEYAGVTGGASVGVGLGANVLVGGSNKSISLQPVSFEGNTGLNVAAGIGAMSLQYSGEQSAQPMPPDNAPPPPPNR
jgi:hypothetical protein